MILTLEVITLKVFKEFYVALSSSILLIKLYAFI